MHTLLLNITPSRRESSSRMSKYWWMAADSSSFVSGKVSKIAFFTVCRVGSQAVSLWSSLTWWSGTGRISEWHWCTLPLLLWLIAHSPPNTLLTGCQLAASPCQACSVSHSHTVEAATVGAPVSWELMPGASLKWGLMVCDLSREPTMYIVVVVFHTEDLSQQFLFNLWVLPFCQCECSSCKCHRLA